MTNSNKFSRLPRDDSGEISLIAFYLIINFFIILP